jgi:hypothetical protein
VGVHDEGVRTADVLTLALVALVVVGVAGAWWWRRRAPGGRGRDGLALDADERREIEEALAAVEQEHGATVQRLLVSHLAVLRNRRVPLRAIHPGAEPPVVRLGFANGTVVRARPSKPGDWSSVVIALSGLRAGTRPGHSLVVESYTVEDGRVGLVIAGPGGVRQRATAVGLETPG